VTVGASTGRILHFSDVHLNISESFSAADNARIPIRYFEDAPLPLLESALMFAKEHVVADPEVFLYTGDHAAHGLFTDEYIAKAVETNVHAMENYFPPKSQDGRMLEATAIIGNADGSRRRSYDSLITKRQGADDCALHVGRPGLPHGGDGPRGGDEPVH
jgi:sphingomyelin phosphodiesterase acid-like 3